MTTLPSANTAVRESAGASGGGVDVICVWSPVAAHADITPRQMGSAQAIYDLHGYSEGLEYCAIHARRTRKGFIFLGLPIAAPGTVGRVNTSGNTGSSVVSIVAGGAGILHEHDGELIVERGGTVGTDQIVLTLSLDGGRTRKRIRLGTASSYVLPYVNASALFAGGTLVAGDTIATWHGTAPKADADGFAAARTALASQLKPFRSVLLAGDLMTGDEASDFVSEMNAYETENQRFIYGRVSVRDRLPQASLSATSWRMTGAPTLTFAEVGDTGDTITRSAGSWLADGFAVGDKVTITGATASAGANNITAVIAALSATVMTLGAEDLAAEVSANCTVVGEAAIVFANSGETLTRNRGSWLDDGFRVGDLVTIDGTSGGINDIEGAEVTAVTALVLTLEAGAVDANETIGVTDVTVEAGQTKAAWMADIDNEFEGVDDQPRIDLSAGRARVRSPFSGWLYRRPAGWFASWREYAHDLHIPSWRKDDGPVEGDLYDADGVLVEWDDRVDGAAGTAARFTTLRTWGNGPAGAFVAQSLTRAVEGSLLGRTHNAAVVNLACTTVQAITETAAIGQSLVLEVDGKATAESLNTIKSRVNKALEAELLRNKQGEGQRASKAVWSPSGTDVFNVPEPALTGVLELLINGTVHTVNTTVALSNGG